MFTNSSKYALKAVLYLALHSNDQQKIMVKDLCEKINVPKAYLSKLLQDLARHEVVSSSKGPKGGFYLNEQNMTMSVLDIVHIIDGRKKTESCLLSLEDCSKDKPCPLHVLVSRSRNEMLNSLKDKSVKDLALDLKHKKAFLPLY